MLDLAASCVSRASNCVEENDGPRFGDYWIGKDLSRAMDEVQFYEKCLKLARSSTGEMQAQLGCKVPQVSETCATFQHLVGCRLIRHSDWMHIPG